ncbi:MAG: tpiA [Burkholderiales bacterium]|jgi:triosephosphate isomerase|nr:tpiA [Burkholderiales bacterium]
MTKKLIVANWKMNGTSEKVENDLNVYGANQITNSPNVVLALPNLYLHHASNLNANFKIASQDVSQFLGYGAYTGEISSRMLLDFKVKYAIIGHSERRQNLDESDILLAKKLENTLNSGIIPIFCIGEEQSVRDSGKYMEFLLAQLGLLTRLNAGIEELIIAYEPVWAVGTGKVPTGEQIAEIVELINSFVQKTLPRAKILVLYGGSVTAKNIAEILQVADIAGVLVGGASLRVDEFTAICAHA